MSIEIDWNTVKAECFVLSKASWLYVFSLINSLSDEEFEKIPEIKSEEQKKFCELYGICDIVNRDKNRYTYIYCLSSYIFRGETKQNKYD